MLTVVCWQWGPKYGAAHVLRLRSMVGRNLQVPHQFVCITDRAQRPYYDGPADVRFAPMPDVPAGARAESRRLWILSRQASELGSRILNLDVDLVIVDDIGPLVDRPEPFVIWQSESVGPHGYALNPSVMLLNAGHLDGIWQSFKRDPAGALAKAKADGFTGSEQAVIGSHFREALPPVWTAADGIVSYRGLVARHDAVDRPLPAGARLVSFHGPRDPGDPALQERAPWIKQHWRS